MTSFRHPLVYVDGRPECERAVHAAVAIAKQGAGKIKLLHIAEPHLQVPELDPELGEALSTGQLEELDRLRHFALDLGVEATCEARIGRPFAEIIRACHQNGCDLVVKAAKGRSKLGWPMLGSTALHLIRKCATPVWLVTGRADPMPRRIMALLASEPDSEGRQALDRRVLEVATSLAEATGAELQVGAAWFVPGESLLRRRIAAEKYREYVDTARRQAEEALGSALEPFGAAINPSRVHLVKGVPYAELVQLAAERADLTVIGTTPPSAGAAFLIREEAEEVINRLETSIVAVKAEDFESPPELTRAAVH